MLRLSEGAREQLAGWKLALLGNDHTVRADRINGVIGFACRESHRF